MEFTTKIRVRQLKAMHEMMVTANDEEIYDEVGEWAGSEILESIELYPF